MWRTFPAYVIIYLPIVDLFRRRRDCYLQYKLYFKIVKDKLHEREITFYTMLHPHN